VRVMRQRNTVPRAQMQTSPPRTAGAQTVGHPIWIAALAAAWLVLGAPAVQAQIGYSGTVADLSLPGQETSDFVFEQDALGSVFAVWIADIDVWAAHRPPGTGVWGQPVVLRRPGGPSGQPYNPAIAVDDLGNAIVVWRRST
jgi:hypothetical protein